METERSDDWEVGRVEREWAVDVERSVVDDGVEGVRGCW